MVRSVLIPEDRIRELAYRLWLEDGQPQGKTGRHWEKARELLAREEEGGILANQGELPAMTDQGEQKIPKQRRPGGARKTDRRPM